MDTNKIKNDILELEHDISQAEKDTNVSPKTILEVETCFQWINLIIFNILDFFIPKSKEDIFAEKFKRKVI
jgi:hypothetical protein